MAAHRNGTFERWSMHLLQAVLLAMGGWMVYRLERLECEVNLLNTNLAIHLSGGKIPASAFPGMPPGKSSSAPTGNEPSS